jgi:hypothetical protein
VKVVFHADLRARCRNGHAQSCVLEGGCNHAASTAAAVAPCEGVG